MRRTLVVDDEGPIRNLIAAVLKRERIPADTAPDGKVALDLLEKNRYGCVILDLMMPITNGLAVIDAMSRDLVPRVPVIVATAAGETVTSDLDPSVVKLIVRKPFDIGKLLDAVRAYCEEGPEDAADAEAADHRHDPVM
jgi:DNA-binding response OmpR family regulator